MKLAEPRTEAAESREGTRGHYLIPTRELLLLRTPSYMQENSCAERSNHLPKVIQPVNNRAGGWIHACVASKSMFITALPEVPVNSAKVLSGPQFPSLHSRSVQK